jgi:hypothetical protein
MRNRGLPDTQSMRWHTIRNRVSSNGVTRRHSLSCDAPSSRHRFGFRKEAQLMHSLLRSTFRRAVSCFHPCHRPWLPLLQLRLQYLASADLSLTFPILYREHRTSHLHPSLCSIHPFGSQSNRLSYLRNPRHANQRRHAFRQRNCQRDTAFLAAFVRAGVLTAQASAVNCKLHLFICARLLC